MRSWKIRRLSRSDTKHSKEDGKKKEEGGDTVAVKRTQGQLRRGEEAANKGIYNHKVNGLQSEDDTRYLSWRRTVTMTATYTKCEQCGDKM